MVVVVAVVVQISLLSKGTGTQFYLEICVRLDLFTDITKGLLRSED
ncbi:hypothetical protein E2C01_095552 [Portunus trituberculatus]|uniref:Uncharacterized protein n=1 Tax=Portunus trituberculatus TaxID=210409 RepID=A0A5B7JQ47_PORTR|nr:hypothetical protein [Portunus trituberculatus]